MLANAVRKVALWLAAGVVIFVTTGYFYQVESPDVTREVALRQMSNDNLAAHQMRATQWALGTGQIVIGAGWLCLLPVLFYGDIVRLAQKGDAVLK